MGPIEFIRTKVLQITQTELAKIARVTQPTVSRWEHEDDDSQPDRVELSRIRDEVILRGHVWNDSWFFEVPAIAAETAEVGR